MQHDWQREDYLLRGVRRMQIRSRLATVHAKKDKRKGAGDALWSFIFPMGTERDDFSAAQLAFKFGARRERLN